MADGAVLWRLGRENGLGIERFGLLEWVDQLAAQLVRLKLGWFEVRGIRWHVLSQESHGLLIEWLKLRDVGVG